LQGPNVAQSDACDQGPGAKPLLDSDAAYSKISVDDLDIGIVPAEISGTSTQHILQA
jgi:hypothetical protein